MLVRLLNILYNVVHFTTSEARGKVWSAVLSRRSFQRRRELPAAAVDRVVTCRQPMHTDDCHQGVGGQCGGECAMMIA